MKYKQIEYKRALEPQYIEEGFAVAAIFGGRAGDIQCL